MPILFVLFIVLPIVEIVVLIQVGRLIGVFPTVALILLTAFIGLALLRRQSLATMQRAQEKMGSGQLPASEMAEGIFLAVGGALLLTPGFVTDAFGFCCLVPFTRLWLMGRVVFPMLKAMGLRSFGVSSAGSFNASTFSSSSTFRERSSTSDHHGEIIDGEIVDDESSDTDPKGLDKR